MRRSSSAGRAQPVVSVPVGVAAWRGRRGRGCRSGGEAGRSRGSPSVIRTRWTAPSSRSGTGAAGSAATSPSTSTRTTPRQTPAGFSTAISVARRAVAELDLEPRPASRDARVDREAGPLPSDPEDRLHRRLVHPAGRTGVPGPAAAADVRRLGVDVGRDHVRLDLVALRPPPASRAWLIGLSIAKSSPARSPSPSARVGHAPTRSRACVYCPPFSRTPGR